MAGCLATNPDKELYASATNWMLLKLFYSFHLCTCILQFSSIDDIIDNGSSMYIFVLLIMIFSGLSVLTSVLMLIGLCMENRFFLLPWVMCVALTTLLDILLSFSILADALSDLVTIIFFIVDYVVCALNIYCVLCVISQYQELLAGRGRSHTVAAAQYRQGGKGVLSQGSGLTSSVQLTVPSAALTSSRGSTDMSSISDDPLSCRRFSRDEAKPECPIASLIKIEAPS
ncbi:uncharacterized protein LOC135396128 isoform X2 [Ornithodoros turicata]|uniref:uncharacterized protein LOC135396128 isoform X2 n=1 Tax=Ornithodoros turicata TaxID=34597 RepID=UPI00313949B6